MSASRGSLDTTHDGNAVGTRWTPDGNTVGTFWEPDGNTVDTFRAVYQKLRDPEIQFSRRWILRQIPGRFLLQDSSVET
jgi:hypothetical protein